MAQTHPPRRSCASSTEEGPTPNVAEATPRDVGEVVDQLLDEVGIETQPDPVLGFAGLRGRVAIVTGASSGIGRAIALGFARAGVHVAFNYLDTGEDSQEEAASLSRSLREQEVRVFCRACDVREPGDVGEFVREAVDRLGSVHILVNNAGIGRDRALWRMSDTDWKDVLDTNLSGAFYCTRAVASHMRRQEAGKIVNIASVHGVRSEFGITNYASSKAGLIGLTKNSAVELGPSNINVNAVAPGYIRTTRLTEGVSAEVLDRARDRSALGRLGDPQDVADVVLFLCSEAARHITGAVIPVDGGYIL